ncbi:MAG TPA: TIM barrel protein [Puia sp.]|jgi:hypothetical protein
MVIKYYYPRWGMEYMPMEDFFRMVKASGFDGAEIALDPDKDDLLRVWKICKAYELDLLVQHPFSKGNTPQEMLKDYQRKLERLMDLEPVMINCHTGKDYYSVAFNSQFIAQATLLAEKHGIPVAHEIHRGRFSFCTALIGDYLAAFPDLSLTADFSHWCLVSESLLEDQQATMEKVIPHCTHIHARVGYAQGPQVPHPDDPAYARELDAHLRWWNRILECHRQQGKKEIAVTCEFGPAPYCHTLPFSGTPVSSQHEINMSMRKFLTENLQLC